MSIDIESLMTAQAYERQRNAHRHRMIAHRRTRSLALGPCQRLHFEDTQTVRYQIQEVIRADRIADAASMQREIDAYAHLVPSGTNWIATLLIGIPEAQERQRVLPLLSEATHCLYVDVPRHPRVAVIANEDLPDRHLTRPSAVHFLRFEFSPSVRQALVSGAPAMLGCSHVKYQFRWAIPPAVLMQLRCELAPMQPHTDAQESVESELGR